MKLLFLNPHVDAAHELVKHLVSQGHVVLNAMDGSEAWQLLKIHGDSVDVAFLHREGIGKDPNPGLTLANKLKSTGEFPGLAVVITTQAWDETQCGLHQSSPEGQNAYLRWPFKVKAVEDLLGQLFGEAPPAAPAPRLEEPGSVQLQDVSSLGEATANTNSGNMMITLDLPDAAGSPPTPPPQSVAMPPMTTVPDGPSIEIPTQTGLQIPVELMSAQASDGPPPPPPAGLTPPAAPSGGTSLEVNLTTVDLGSGSIVEPPLPPPSSDHPVEDVPDAEAEAEMPYLYGGGAPARAPVNPLDLVEPVGDAIIPGGAGQSPDTETLKKYLMLREQDVAVLSNQLRSAKEQITAMEQTLRQERSKNNELSHVVAEQSRSLQEFEERKQNELGAVKSENQELRYEAKAKSDKARLLENQVREAQEEIERIKERVRTDIRKIRVRERELENKLEILKKDSEALIGARESKIIELKRKLDLLEFNMDLLQDQLQRERENASAVKQKLAKAAQVVRVAGGLLDQPGHAMESPSGGGEDEAQSA